MPRIFLQNAILLRKGRFLPLGPSPAGLRALESFRRFTLCYPHGLPMAPEVDASFPREPPGLARGTCRDPAWCNTCNNPNGVWCKTNAFFLGQEGLAGTRDRGIFWEQRDPQGPAGTWTRVTLAMTRGNGDPRCVFLGGKRDPRAPRWWYSMGKRGTQVKVRRDARLQESESSRRLAVSRL